MGQTLSFSVGRVAVLHDIRQEISANVDPTLSHNNMTLVDKLAPFGYDIEAYTNDRFQPIIDEYNAKQKRADRRKTKPYVELVKEENAKRLATAQKYKEQGIKKTCRKPTELVREYVVQIGDRESNGTLNCDMSKNQEFARQFIDEFQQKYPHVEILLAEFHGDEPNGTPHLHLLTQFVGEGYAQGLSRQISTSKALECDGIARAVDRGDENGFSLNRWIEKVKDETMQPLLEDIFQEERLELGEHRKHEDVQIFRKKAQKEAKAIEDKHEELMQTHDNLVAFRETLVEASQSLDKRIEEHEANVQAFEDEKAEFEAYRASETQKLDDRERELDERASDIGAREYAVGKKERTVKRAQADYERDRDIFLDKIKKKQTELDEAMDDSWKNKYMRALGVAKKWNMGDGRTMYDELIRQEQIHQDMVHSKAQQAINQASARIERQQNPGKDYTPGR